MQQEQNKSIHDEKSCTVIPIPRRQSILGAKRGNVQSEMTERDESIQIWHVIKVRFVLADPSDNPIKTHPDLSLDILPVNNIKILCQVNASMMYKAGVNPIEVLLWSRKRKLGEVLQAMKMIANNVEIEGFI